jgi:hypothetical protein
MIVSFVGKIFPKMGIFFRCPYAKKTACSQKWEKIPKNGKKRPDFKIFFRVLMRNRVLKKLAIRLLHIFIGALTVDRLRD